jgi:hypothetical protein
MYKEDISMPSCASMINPVPRMWCMELMSFDGVTDAKLVEGYWPMSNFL